MDNRTFTHITKDGKVYADKEIIPVKVEDLSYTAKKIIRDLLLKK